MHMVEEAYVLKGWLNRLETTFLLSSNPSFPLYGHVKKIKNKKAYLIFFLVEERLVEIYNSKIIDILGIPHHFNSIINIFVINNNKLN
jgi:hypothetical protein